MSKERLCPCQFQIPLRLNDGSETPPEALVTIYAAIRRQFGAYAILGVRDGFWEGQAEPSQWIEVAVPMERVPELRELVYAIGKRLGQRAMYFDAPPPTVELIEIEEDTFEQRDSSLGEGG